MIRRIDKGDERGAALVLVMVVVLVMSIGLAALLTFADTNIRATVALRSQASAAYGADGAMQVAINGLRQSTYNNSTGQHCFGASDTLSLPNFNGSNLAVTCAPDTTSGIPISCTASKCNRPGNAILTLATTASGEDGINVIDNGSGMNIDGGVFSNSKIVGKFTTTGDLYARGSCTNSPYGPADHCNYGTTANAAGNDPNYVTDTASAPAYQALPSCATNPVQFSPGYYDDAVGLSNITTGVTSGCSGKVFWFRPGAYYFDFHNRENPALTSAQDLWTISTGYVVAGTPCSTTGTVAPKNACQGGVLAQPPTSPSIPGSCVPPLNRLALSNPGAQFIFGGDSRLSITGGKVEICGTYSTSKVPVAVYGLKSGSETTTTLNGSNTLKLTAIASAGSFSGATVASLANADQPAAGSFATWAKSGTSSQNTTVGVTGYVPPSAIPAGSIINSASLRVVHREPTGATSGNTTVTATVTPAGGTALTPSNVTVSPNAWNAATIDIKAALNAKVHTAGFTGARVDYKVSTTKAGNYDLDTIQLDISYTPPAFRAQNTSILGSNCLSATPYTRAGRDTGTTCPAIYAYNASVNPLFYVQGTTYLPIGVLDVTLDLPAASTPMNFGVIVRDAFFGDNNGSFSGNGAAYSLPADSPGFAFLVFLNVYAANCSGSPAVCTPTGSSKLSSRVAIVDNNVSSPTAGQRQMYVLSWSVQR